MTSEHDDARVVTGDGPINRRTALRHERQQRDNTPPPPELVARLERAQARHRLGAPLAETVSAHTEASHAPATPKQIVAGVTLAAGVLVSLLGVIQWSQGPWTLGAGAVLASAGAAAWWLSRPQAAAANTHAAAPLFDGATLQTFDTAVQAAAAELGDAAVAQLQQLKAVLARLAPQRLAHDEHFTPEDRLFLRECLRRYVPDSLEAFLRVPAHQRSTVLHAGQPSADQTLLHQLRLLTDEVTEREKKIGRSAAERLLQQQRFLESKKSR